MTDLDPIQHVDRTNDDLEARAGRELPPTAEAMAHQEMRGPTGREQTTESVGDPDGRTVSSGSESGAGAGMMAGAAIAGPIGLPIGAAAGAVVGGAAEAADEDTTTNEPRPMAEPASQGTGPVDPEKDPPERPVSRT